MLQKAVTSPFVIRVSREKINAFQKKKLNVVGLDWFVQNNKTSFTLGYIY